MNNFKSSITNKERIVWIALLIAVSAFSFFPGQKARALSEKSEKELHLFHEILALIETNFVSSVDESVLVHGAINGLLKSLNDPHTRFMDENTFGEFQNETKGSFGGLGIEVSYSRGNLVIISPIDDTPAKRAGLQPQDIITEINGKKTSEMSMQDAIGMMRGDVGSSISLTISRKGSEKPIKVSLIREIIKMKFVKSAYLEQEKIGYLRLSQFMGTKNTINEIKEILTSFSDKGANGLIIDLRMNPGGLLGMSIELANLFLQDGMEIVSIRGREGKTIRSFKSDNQVPEFTRIPMVVLINKGSASASEIFSGAIQDHARGKILGEVSFGKGSVQEIYNLPYNTGLALTIQKYYTPKGVSIHGKGIKPDIKISSLKPDVDEKYFLGKMQRSGFLSSYVKENPDYSEESFRKFFTSLNKAGYSIREPIARLVLKNSSRYTSQDIIDRDFDIQLSKAIELLKK